MRHLFLPLVLLVSTVGTLHAQETDRQLDVTLLFHFNQDLVPSAHMASQVAYTGLLETLRKHPETPVQIQISGVLLNALSWWNPKPIEIIREGVEAGQFEIVGSTYSQNVMFASGDAWTNDLQIKTHRQLLKQHFDAEPVGFWNPERVWTQSFVDLLAENGYEYTFVEGHIIEDSGAGEPLSVTRRTRTAENELAIIHDDQTMIGLFDGARDSGDADSLLAYLRALYDADTEDRFLVAYCQDAEASGLWQFEGASSPEEAFASLDSLLTVLESTGWLNVTTGGRFLAQNAPAVELSPIVDGQATWMIAFVDGMGFEDWYEYWERDTLQEAWRALLQEVRDSLHALNDDLETAGRPAAASALFDRAVRTFLAHEYEFGASWYWTPEWSDFWLSTEAYASVLAARHALSPGTASYSADINRDGIDEIVMADTTDLFVFSPQGGRLLYWFDLERGESLVGNENTAYYFERYVDGNRYLPELRGTREVYPWHVSRLSHFEIRDYTYQLRRRALNDWLYDSGVLVDSLVFREYTVDLDSRSVSFQYESGEVGITKKVSVVPAGGLEIEYGIHNRGTGRKAVTFVVESGFSPSYLNVMDQGRNALAYWNGQPQEALDPNSTAGVMNVNTGTTVYFQYRERPFYIEGDEVAFGLEVNPRYVFILEPSEEQTVRFGLRRAISDGR